MVSGRDSLVSAEVAHGPAKVIWADQRHQSKERVMAKVNRSATTGKFVSSATAARHPRTTISQTVPSQADGNRSAISGRFITEASAKRHPKTSVREGR